MAMSRFNSKSPTIRRIMREAQELSASPSPDFTATPLESDLFEWHFTLRGPPDSVYADGLYHGRIVLPPTYPLRPPSFRFVTPSGRFEANREICLSISGHHEETWQPAWGVRTALVALRSFMETDPRGQLGGLETTDAVRRRLAAESRAFRCPACGGRSNADIIAEAEAEAAAAGDGGPAGAEVEVPAELKMGWRDEMGKNPAPAAAAAAAAATAPSEDPEVAELAEGFVQTVAPQPQLQPQPQPTRTVPLAPIHRPAAAAAMGAPLVQAARPQYRASPDGVPVWVDRAIAIVSVMLLAMFLKVLVV
ncbi:ubiquitin-conjugating enzyme [Gaeumannomyces tritici R3-111a-1]|uniref:Ubiquitin-conjugating enzyme n=1 Tax=Gaeumannomyces tritici (strain R3-111a-1) TaxID=644352 RepID=J3NYB8_GAET3|nr:ubiquitin-conjugating enzyme [Gaeumannomyces tritici R3-111a-1]EJT76351.1 ubiquitin-conjugating enzyme [Gaeumannomyces tritici R3-111a-1]